MEIIQKPETSTYTSTNKFGTFFPTKESFANKIPVFDVSFEAYFIGSYANALRTTPREIECITILI